VKLLVFGHNDWWTWERQGFCTRAAALVRALAARAEVQRVLVVDALGPRGAAARPEGASRDEVCEVAPKIAAVRFSAPLRVPLSWHAGRRLTEILAGPGLRRRVRRALGRDDGATVLWVSDPQLVRFAATCDHDLFVFDAIDDWREHWWVDRAAVDAGYRYAGRRADLVTAVTAEMVHRLGAGERGMVVPNAVDGALWREPHAAAAGFPALRRPLVAYVGMIQERLDLGLLAGVATRLPEVSFALAGTVLLRGVADSSARALTAADIWAAAGVAGPAPDNVTYVGPVAHGDLPAWLAGCDATIVPHVHDRMTSSMDPLKIYEYLAAGLPVVSTVPVSSRPVSRLVRIADGVEGFSQALREELDGDDADRRAARRAALGAETWARRAGEVAGTLTRLLDDASPETTA
jgi:glycosyltransferase involved in cell wall biosynthesis